MRLRAWRKDLDLTLIEAAAFIGVSKSALARYEVGQGRSPDHAESYKIFIATEGAVTPDDLFAVWLETRLGTPNHPQSASLSFVGKFMVKHGAKLKEKADGRKQRARSARR